MVAMVWEFQGFALMRNFTTEDPAVQKQEDFFRWRLDQQTLRARAQKLEERAQMVADKPERFRLFLALASILEAVGTPQSIFGGAEPWTPRDHYRFEAEYRDWEML
jgi:hypothetical protein